ncbi:helix-turn-helix transcriptional regulator [Candidatus Thioglobus sp.]|nr:helix-turn-helix transcriptional regulator [Candidatus Thioglobus sp.]
MFKKKIHIKNTVRKLRFNNNEMTQQQLAEKVGVSRQTIVAIEKYKYTPSLDLAFKIALAFEMEIQDVFFINQ